METPPPRRPNLSGFLSESARILTASYTHFIALSVFFLPLSFLLITIHNFLQKHLILIIFYILIVYLFSLCAVATITYSTYHAKFSTPVNFSTTLKSLTSSFFPIVITAVMTHSLLFIPLISFLLFIKFVINYTSVYFMCLSAVTYAIFIVTVTYFHVNWSLAFVVVVAESKMGFAALRRSSYLVKGMGSVSLLLFLYFVFLVAISVWVVSDCIHVFSDWGYVLFSMMIGSILLMSYLCHMTAATAVLYNYCSAYHGELAIDGLFDEKVHHVVEA